MTLAAVAEAATFVDLAGLLVAGEVDGMAVDYLSWGFYTPAVWRNTPHTHSFHEVCLAYAGSGTFTVEGTAHPVAAGELFVARPGEVHEIVSHPEAGLGIAFWGFALDTTALPEGPGGGTACCAVSARSSRTGSARCPRSSRPSPRRPPPRDPVWTRRSRRSARRS